MAHLLLVRGVEVQTHCDLSFAVSYSVLSGHSICITKDSETWFTTCYSRTYVGNFDGEVAVGDVVTMLPVVVNGWMATVGFVGWISREFLFTLFIHVRFALKLPDKSSNSRSTFDICDFMLSTTSVRSRS